MQPKTRRLFNTVKRTGQWDTYKETLTCYNRETRKAKLSSWRRYCQDINYVPGSARLMKIMAQQATNRVSSIKLPDNQYTKSGKRTLKELFRVHFPDSKLIEDSDDGHGQQNLGIYGCVTNRGNWNLAKYVIKQSEIRWALDTFKTFKSVGTDGIAPALLQQRMEHLVLHLCATNLEPAWHMALPPWPEGKLE
jgi:hypothetical protein